MIYIKNQITAIFNIGDIKDFIDPENLISFVLYENAGNLRPILKMSFTLTDMKILNLINAGNLLEISFGINEPSKDVVKFQFTEDISNLNYTLGSNVNVTAALYIPKMMEYTRCHTYSNTYSYDVIKQIADRHRMNFVSNINSTNDRQNWYQNGKTDWDFLSQVWHSSYITNKTFTCFAFDYDNIYFHDTQKLILKEPTWTFSINSIGGSNIVNFGQYWTTNRYGITDSLLGKNIINTTYNVDTGEFSNSDYSLRNLTLLDSNKINLNENNARNYSYNITCDDYHNNNISAINQNIRNNIMFSSYSIIIPTAGQFKKFKLLQTVKVEPGVEDRRIQGLSFITGITYQYVDQKLMTNIILNKEAPNAIKGENLKVGV